MRTGKLYVCSGNKEGEEQQCSINLKADTEPCKRCLFDKCKAKGMTRLGKMWFVMSSRAMYTYCA